VLFHLRWVCDEMMKPEAEKHCGNTLWQPIPQSKILSYLDFFIVYLNVPLPCLIFFRRYTNNVPSWGHDSVWANAAGEPHAGR
jgi:hypothetical protein